MSVTGIRFYVEGAQSGANSKLAKSDARKAFHVFLTELRTKATECGLEWHSIALCGSRQKAYENFCSALEREPTVFPVLLIDAEEDALGSTYESGAIWSYLAKRVGDGWVRPPAATEQHVYLMVRTMETWIVADRENLARFYKGSFNEKALPQRTNLEEAPKAQVYEGLKKATEKTKSGAYHKTKHAFTLLETTNPETVKGACKSCRRLFSELAARFP